MDGTFVWVAQKACAALIMCCVMPGRSSLGRLVAWRAVSDVNDSCTGCMPIIKSMSNVPARCSVNAGFATPVSFVRSACVSCSMWVTSE